MSKIVNVEQATAWNGYEGRHWAEHDDRYDAVNAGYNQFLLAEVGADDRVLDIGCGTGQLTRLAANKATHATGVDLSEPMLAMARKRAAGIPNVSFEQGDVQVYPFEEGSFDIAISRFGATFFADPVAAFANARHALSPGGRIAFVCMTTLAGTDLGTVFGSMSAYLPQPTGKDGEGPTAFADPERPRAILTDVGFRGIDVSQVEADQVWGRDVPDALEFITGWGPVKYHMDLAGPDAASKARQALEETLGSFAESGEVRLRGTAWLVRASV